MQTLPATELARRTRTVLDRVVQSRQSVVIERNGVPVAVLGPAPERMSAAQAFDFGPVPLLSPEEGAAWLRDSRDAAAEPDWW